MNNKVLAAAAVVVVVVVAAVAIYTIWDRGGGDSSVSAPEIRTDVEVGDYFSLMYTDPETGDSYTETVTVTAINGDNLTIRITVDDAEVSTTTTTAEFFVAPIVVTDSDIESEGATRAGSEVIGTPFGNINCDIWEVSEEGYWSKVWVGVDNGVMYRGESEYTYEGVTEGMRIDLVATSLFGPASGSQPVGPETPVDLRLREDYGLGDYITMRITMDTPVEQSTDIETEYYLYRDAEDGDDIMWRNSSDYTGVVHIENYLNNIVATSDELAAFERGGSVRLDTALGIVECDIWTGASSDGDMKVWVCPDNNVVFRVEISATIDGQSYLLVRELIETTLFDAQSPTEPSDVTYADSTYAGMRVGDFYSYRMESVGIDSSEMTCMVLRFEDDTVTYYMESVGSGEVHEGTTQEFYSAFMMDVSTVDPNEVLRTETISTIAGDVECYVLETTADWDGIPMDMTMWVSVDSGVNYRVDVDMGIITSSMTLQSTSLLVTV